METNVQKIIRYSSIIFALKINLVELNATRTRLERINVKLSDIINHITLSIDDLKTKVIDIQMEIKILILPLFKDKLFGGYIDPTSPYWALSKSEMDKGYVILQELITNDSYVLFLSNYKDSTNTYKEGDLVKLKEVAHILGNIASYRDYYKNKK